MKYTNKQAREMYEKFRSVKIITGVKNSNLEIKYIKSYIWMIPLYLILSVLGILRILSEEEMIIAYIAIITFAILGFLGFLSQYYKLYYENNNLILKNKLNKKIVIDINRQPRIYCRHNSYMRKSYHSDILTTVHIYNLYIQQDNNEMVFDIETMGKKLVLFLNNIEIKEGKDISEAQWQESSSEKEKNFSNYMSFLNKQEKVIGVKDMSKKMKINNVSDVKKRLLICTILVIISFILDYIVNFVFHVSEISIFRDFFTVIGGMLAILDFMFFLRLIEQGKNASLRISYPSNTSIKINNYLLNYEENNVMIGIKAIQTEKSFEQYDYFLVIHRGEVSFSIKLELQNEKQLGEFIDNLIFEPKKV